MRRLTLQGQDAVGDGSEDCLTPSFLAQLRRFG